MENAGCTKGPEPLVNRCARFSSDYIIVLLPFGLDVVKMWYRCDEVAFLSQHPDSGGQRAHGIVLSETVRERGASKGNRDDGSKRARYNSLVRVQYRLMAHQPGCPAVAVLDQVRT
jgi:hypothetical protein